MGTEMEQAPADGNGEPPVFEQRGEAIWAIRKGEEVCLGPALPAMAAMAEFLGRFDFGE